MSPPTSVFTSFVVLVLVLAQVDVEGQSKLRKPIPKVLIIPVICSNITESEMPVYMETSLNP